MRIGVGLIGRFFLCFHEFVGLQNEDICERVWLKERKWRKHRPVVEEPEAQQRCLHDHDRWGDEIITATKEEAAVVASSLPLLLSIAALLHCCGGVGYYYEGWVGNQMGREREILVTPASSYRQRASKVVSPLHWRKRKIKFLRLFYGKKVLSDNLFLHPLSATTYAPAPHPPDRPAVMKLLYDDVDDDDNDDDTTTTLRYLRKYSVFCVEHEPTGWLEGVGISVFKWYGEKV